MGNRISAFDISARDLEEKRDQAEKNLQQKNRELSRAEDDVKKAQRLFDKEQRRVLGVPEDEWPESFRHANLRIDEARARLTAARQDRHSASVARMEYMQACDELNKLRHDETVREIGETLHFA